MTKFVAAGQNKVARGEGTLSVVGLGSCVAVILYDAESGVGGMAHILLPDPSLSHRPEKRLKFATTAIPDLLIEMEKAGAVRKRIKARLVGGASMFSDLMTSSQQNIGERNVVAARETLEANDVDIVAEDVGGEYGRSVRFRLKDGKVQVRSPAKEEKIFV